MTLHHDYFTLINLFVLMRNDHVLKIIRLSK